MTGSSHLITGGSLVTAVPIGMGVRDSRPLLPTLVVAFCRVVGQTVFPLFLLTLFLLVLFLLTLTHHSKRMRKSQGGNS